MNLTESQFLYVAQKANELGSQGYKVVAVCPPYKGTQSPFDFVFVIDKNAPKSGTQS